MAPRLETKTRIKNKIQELRTQKDLTQQQLAEQVEVTRATIIALERGSYNPSLELAFRLARYFRKGIEDIFSEEPSK